MSILSQFSHWDQLKYTLKWMSDENENKETLCQILQALIL